MNSILIFGHKRPDTDSVTSAIALSYLKNKLGANTKPKILGELNNETKFVLDYFNVEKPGYLNDVKIQIKDLDYYKGCFVNHHESIKSTYDYMLHKDITGVPIVDDEERVLGLITTKMIGSELINGDFTKLKTSYDNIKDVLKGMSTLKIDDEINGNIIAAAYRSTTILNNIEFDKDTILIVGDRHSVIESAVNTGIKLLIITGGNQIKEEHLQLAKENNVNIITTEYDTFHTSKLLGLSNYIEDLLTERRNVTVNENEFYDDFKKSCTKLGYNNYPVVNNKGKCLGLVRITDIKDINKKKVILVDHNEFSQSVEGLDEAEILEIIDHHKLGSITTSMPINFRNMTVGSTNTILYSMYQESHVEIPGYIAGLMLSGILSDTLKFTSPTTTEYDKFVAYKLASIANLDIDMYSNKMFKAGTNFSGKSIKEIIEMDMKTFDIDGSNILISQVVTMNPDEILSNIDKYIDELDKIKIDRELKLSLFCVTDILKSGSYIIFNRDSKELVSNSFNRDMNEGEFIKNCLSRKKQLVPLIMEQLVK